MTIDKRLEKLTERHEALAQTVELIVGMQRENETRLGKLLDGQRENEIRLGKLLDGIEALTHIAESHERRISGLENN